MTRLGRFLLVALLAFSASGALELLDFDDCSPTESSSSSTSHKTCPPTCVRCSCCAQAVDFAPVASIGAAVTAGPNVVDVAESLPTPQASEILHVPKSHLA